MEKKTKKPKIVTKPFLQGSVTDRATAKDAAKFFGSTVLMLVLFLLLCSMMMWDSLLLRLITNGVVLAMAYILFYAAGVSKGSLAVNQGEMMYQREQQGKNVDPGDRRACYHPLKGYVTGALGVLPLFLCALAFAFIAQRQMYGLSVLPSWLEGYMRRSDIGGALAYYSVHDPIGVEDVLRMIVRMMDMPLVSILGTDNADRLLLLERLSPLLALLPGALYGFGYTRGVAARTRVHSSIAAANRKHRRKEKKLRQRRMQGPEQLN